MKKLLTILLAAVLTVSLAACGGDKKQEENLPIQSRGLFVLEREDGTELDSLNNMETYLIHVYDIIPDEVQNAELSSFGSGYTMTLNGVNKYEALDAPRNFKMGSGATKVQYFMLASGYATPMEIGSVFAGSEPIRAMSIYKVNKNDIKDDMTAVFAIKNSNFPSSGPYDCEVKLGDAAKITRFDDVFDIEDDPTDYKIAAAYFQRIKTMFNNTTCGVNFEKLNNGDNAYKTGVNFIKRIKDGVFSVTKYEGGDISSSVSFEGNNATITTVTTAPDDLPRFDPEAVKRVYPDLPVDKFEEALDLWIQGAEAYYNDGVDTQNVTNLAMQDVFTYGQKIINFYTSMLSSGNKRPVELDIVGKYIN